jgi:hypothetical protein
MPAHLAPRPLCVARLHAGEYPFVLEERPLRVAGAGCADPAAGPEQVHYRLQHREQHPVARRPRQPRVELHVGVHVPLGRFDGAAHPLHLDPHLLHVFRTRPPGGEARHLDLQDAPHLQQLPQRLRLDPQEQAQSVAHGPRLPAAHDRPAAVLDADEPAGLHEVQGLPDDGPAHAESLAELALRRQALARPQTAGDHHVQDLPRRPVP